jgi:glycosyltransferase involved in cell wall biosynthesis
MGSPPLVSVIISTYYRNEELKRAIESVNNQTYDNIEIIVIDDSGEGNAQEVIRQFDVKYFAKEQNEGQIAAWNAGFEQSSGKYIQFLDDDDQLCRSKIEKQIKKFKESKGVGVVYCGISWETGRTVLPYKELRGDVLSHVLMLDSGPCVTSAMLIKRAPLARINSVPSYPASTDNVLKIELAQLTIFDYVNEPLVIRGKNEKNVSGTIKKTNISWQLLNDYKSIYIKYSKKVRLKAVSNICHSRAKIYLQRNFWSLRARVLLIYAIYISPDLDRKLTALLLRSIGGSHAIWLAMKVKQIRTVLSKIKRCKY